MSLLHMDMDVVRDRTAELVGGPAVPTGRYRYTVAGQTWWWSDELYLIHGFQPGEVVPTTELWLAHKHSDDLEFVREVVTSALVQPGQFTCRHRIVDARQRVRTVLMVGRTTESDGQVVQVHGYLVDLTESERRGAAQATALAVEQSVMSRAVIEQAKGALIASERLTADEAFTALRKHSQHHNIKLRDLAAALVDSFTDPAAPPASEVQRVAGLLVGPGRTR